MWTHPELHARDSAGYAPPKVSASSFLGAVWTLTALSFLFLPARFYARWKACRRFYADDFLVLFAWILSLSITAAITAFNHVTYLIMYLGSGDAIPFPSNIKIIVMQFSRIFTIVPMIFYTGIWCVKLAFLLFFRRLGTQNIVSLKRWWLGVTVFTVVCYFACFASLPYRCCLVSYEVLASPECQTQGLAFTSMKINTVLDVFTDLLIMSIPFLILRRVHLGFRQRLVLSGIFSLVVVTIIFAIVRAILTTVDVKRQMDPIWMYMWTNIELNVAIIVACVAPYRSFFIRERPPPSPANNNNRGHGNPAKVFTTSSDPASGRDAWLTADLPYMAPWRDHEEGIRLQDAQTNEPHDSALESAQSRKEDTWSKKGFRHFLSWGDEGQSSRPEEGGRELEWRSIPEAHVRK